MSGETSLIMIIIGAALINNVVLSQFLGICSFLGVSSQIKNSAGLGGAVIFVITIASAVANLLYTFILSPLGLDYLGGKTRYGKNQLCPEYCQTRFRQVQTAGGIFLP